jgi:hypothetical protein
MFQKQVVAQDIMRRPRECDRCDEVAAIGQTIEHSSV